MILVTYTKQPNEVKDYDTDYSPWLTPMGDTLDHVEVSVECLSDPNDTSLVVDDDVPMTTDTVKIWVSGGTDGNRYKVTLLVTTVGGRTDESEIVFKVRDY